jgi:tetratricopeptide (TPR) repeat protein
LEQALAMSRELGDPSLEGRVLSNLGGVAIHQGDDAAAQAFLKQAVMIHRATGNRAMEARVLNNLAAHAISHGRFTESEAPLERALVLSCELQNPMEEATAMSHLGYLAMRRGEFARAQALHERALATARAFGVREFELEELRHLGETVLAQGDVPAARMHFRDALLASKEIGNLHEIALCLEALTMLMVKAKEHEIAARLCGAADALRTAIATPRAYGEQETYDETVAHCRQALGEPAASAAVVAGGALSSDNAVARAIGWIDKPVT